VFRLYAWISPKKWTRSRLFCDKGKYLSAGVKFCVMCKTTTVPNKNNISLAFVRYLGHKLIFCVVFFQKPYQFLVSYKISSLLWLCTLMKTALFHKNTQKPPYLHICTSRHGECHARCTISVSSWQEWRWHNIPNKNCNFCGIFDATNTLIVINCDIYSQCHQKKQ